MKGPSFSRARLSHFLEAFKGEAAAYVGGREKLSGLLSAVARYAGAHRSSLQGCASNLRTLADLIRALLSQREDRGQVYILDR